MGTVQLGMPYGIANTTGKPDQTSAKSIVKASIESGIVTFDTAQGYGDSERVLGNTFKELGCAGDVRVVSKIGADPSDGASLKHSVEQSLVRLDIRSLYGLLLHREEALDSWGNGLQEAFNQCIESGLIQKAGISVYDPEVALKAIGTDGIDLIQIPSNLFDRRFERIGVFEAARESGKTLYVRSVFLQGLIFMKPEQLPAKLRQFTSEIEALDALAMRWDLSRLELALGYAKAAYGDAGILFGAETEQQVKSNVAAWNVELPDECVDDLRETFSNVSTVMLNPAKWS